jgi:hypothetical protein
MTAARCSRWRRGALAAMAAVILLGACGGGDDDDAAEPEDDPTSTTDGSVALEATLLTPADLDTGNDLDATWAVGDVSEGVDIQLPECLVETAADGATASAETKLVTETDLKLPSLEQDVAAFDAGGAAAAFEAATARLDGCTPEFVYQGTPAMGAIARLPLTLGGEQSAAWRTTVTIAGAGVSITTVHLQDGDLEASLVHVDLGTPDPAVLEGYVAKALAKLG